jgi:hypothetical protein
MFRRITMTRAVIEAHKVFKPIEPEITEYARMQKSFQDNRERLKLERLSREEVAVQRG